MSEAITSSKIPREVKLSTASLTSNLYGITSLRWWYVAKGGAGIWLKPKPTETRCCKITPVTLVALAR